MTIIIWMLMMAWPTYSTIVSGMPVGLHDGTNQNHVQGVAWINDGSFYLVQ